MSSLPACISELLVQTQGAEREALLAYGVAHGHGVEIADFAQPNLLDDAAHCRSVIDWYKRRLPEIRGLVSLHAAFRELSPASVDAKVRGAACDRVTQSLDIAEELGARYLVGHSDLGFVVLMSGRAAPRVERLAEFWRDAMGGRRVGLLLENSMELTPDIMASGFDAIGPTAEGICFDPAHAHLCAFLLARWQGQATWDPPAAWITALGARVRYLHLSDNDLSGDQHLAPGSGLIDWRGMVAAMNGQGLRVPAVVEVPGVAGLEATVQYLRELEASND